jgi:hypothetical protein
MVPNAASTDEQTRGSLSRGWIAFLVCVFVLGALLRNVALTDMEYKGDERWMFERTQRIGIAEHWPWLGMNSGAGIRNPGLSVWVFVAPARLLHLRAPTSLARVVTVLATVSIGLWLLFAARQIPAAQREPWLWAGALGAVNPGAVLLQRKIWAQSLLPILTVATLWGWWHRRTWWGAFLWGAVGASLGQIHMSGFFFACAFFLWTLLFDRDPENTNRRIRWEFWLLGSACTAWPLVPWAREILHAASGASASQELFQPIWGGFWRYWLLEIAALHPIYSLGWDSFRQWLAWPRIGGHAIYGVLSLYVFALVLLIGALVGWARSLWRRRAAGQRLAGASSTGLVQNATLVGFGLLLTFSGLQLYPHYLVVAFPLTYLWLARATLASSRRGRPVLVGLFAVYALISINLAWYIHTQHGSPGGDYGVTYSQQIAPQKQPR